MWVRVWGGPASSRMDSATEPTWYLYVVANSSHVSRLAKTACGAVRCSGAVRPTDDGLSANGHGAVAATVRNVSERSLTDSDGYTRIATVWSGLV